MGEALSSTPVRPIITWPTDKIPEVIPSYPGLDGAVHGGRTTRQSQRRTVGTTANKETFYSVVKGKGFKVLRDLRQIGRRTVLSACFDPESFLPGGLEWMDLELTPLGNLPQRERG